ncbi:sporulation protein [Bacillus sp. SA1-12]|uniref:sporulation membrane protein YtrI n=1 Tax=Bacillus sp. SA1-12 TaxID=1455638 RepID=UPI000625D56B|nr:sporulation membrane protein YtrI [Bacillus sp. SA1-12]KKI91727.1 sporulation protein [Bacillus sp. SA1-12]
MRIPQHYQQPSWQRFFAGAAIGAVISWCVFLFMFGVIQEKHSTKITEQQVVINDLKKSVEIYQEEFTKLNKEAQKKVTVQDIEIDLTNGEKYHFQKFQIENIERIIEDDLLDLIAKELEGVISNHKLIKRTIENRTLSIDDKNYKLKVTHFFLSTTIYIEVEISYLK